MSPVDLELFYDLEGGVSRDVVRIVLPYELLQGVDNVLHKVEVTMSALLMEQEPSIVPAQVFLVHLH